MSAQTEFNKNLRALEEPKQLEPQEEKKALETKTETQESVKTGIPNPQDLEVYSDHENNSQQKLDETIGYLNRLDDEKSYRLNAEKEEEAQNILFVDPSQVNMSKKPSDSEHNVLE